MPFMVDPPIVLEGGALMLPPLTGPSPAAHANDRAPAQSLLDAHATNTADHGRSMDDPLLADTTRLHQSPAGDVNVSDISTMLAASLQACQTNERQMPEDEVARDYVPVAKVALYESARRKVDQIIAITNSLSQEVHLINSPHLCSALKLHGMASALARLTGKIETWERRSQKEIDLLARDMYLVDVPVPKDTMVDTTEKVREMVEAICAAAESASAGPNLTIDLEGMNLGHNGTISLMQIHVGSINHVFLLDVTTLDQAAFDTAVTIDNTSVSMRSIIEDSSIKKLLWDCRSDAEALKARYNISLAGAIDVQLMDVITRHTKKERSTVKSLSAALPERLTNTLNDATLSRWSSAKYWGGQAMGGRLAEAEAEFRRFGGDAAAAKAEAKKMTPEQEALHKQAKADAKASAQRVMLKFIGCPTCGHKVDDSSQIVDDEPASPACESPEKSTGADLSDGAEKSSTESTNVTTASAAQSGVASAVTSVPIEFVEMSRAEDAFSVRPLPDFLVKYAIGDVYLLPILYQHFLVHER